MLSKIIVRHPYFVIISVTVFCTTCLILPFILRPLPHFSDPQVGFETRGTVISQRLTAWSNLLDATKPSGSLYVDPREIIRPATSSGYYSKPKVNKKLKPNQKVKKKKIKKDYGDSKVYIFATQRNKSDVEKTENQWKDLKELANNMFKTKNRSNDYISTDGFFCGTPDQRYSRVVVSSTDDSSLFTYKSMLALCHIERQMIQNDYFPVLCDTIKKHHCCHPWSLVNYIALLHDRTSCLAITEQDVTETLVLLQTCSVFYHNLQLSHDININNYRQVPSQCTRHNAVFNILHYLTDINFLSPNVNNSANSTHLRQSTIFLPIGCSSKTLEYYQELRKNILSYNHVKVVAMEFGLKYTLFDEYLIKDSWLIFSGVVSVLVCMWIYTESLFVTFMTITAIMFSLGVSYFIYTLVFELNFFPFMNLLATIVVVGIGADDVFIFCKVWYIKKLDSNNSSVVELMAKTFKHAMLSMLVTSLTTAAAFYSSLFSSITTVCCFGVFAGTAIIANFFLMSTWLPASIVISERWNYILFLPKQLISCDNKLRAYRETIDRFWVYMEKFLLVIILKFRYFWLIFLSSLAIISLIIVLKYPGLQLPESTEFQLFQDSHPFEQYDLYYKHRFWYERQKVNNSVYENYKLPLRFVWGILPEDNGNYMDPYSKGTLQLDPSFDIADPLSQMWLLNFCRELRTQPFYLSSFGPLLPNCFIESFLSWMQRRCTDPINNIDRTPCCEINPFPYERNIFEICIIQAISALYETPKEYYMPGVAGPKFTKNMSFPTVKAIVVEYDSTYSFSLSYNYIEDFYNQVENWTQGQLKNAPTGMNKGWFISELDFYDLQKVLLKSTLCTIGFAMGIAFIIMWLVTLNILISLYAIYSIACSIFTTMAILVLFGWKLNVLESIAVSTAMGLAVDYSLHYGISYKLSEDNANRQTSTRQAISNMAGSTAMAALTTGAAGAFMLPSSVLPYIQIGIFLVVVMSVSWLYSTFLFNALLSIAGPEREFGQFSYSFLKGCISIELINTGQKKSAESEANVSFTKSKQRTHLLSEASISKITIACDVPELESHELNSLTEMNYAQN